MISQLIFLEESTNKELRNIVKIFPPQQSLGDFTEDTSGK